MAYEAAATVTLIGQQQGQVDAWRQEWEYATPERQQAISHVHKAQVINAYVKGLCMLLVEARLGLNYLELPMTIPTQVFT